MAMAPTASEPPPPLPLVAEPKKAARLNPTRRRAAKLKDKAGSPVEVSEKIVVTANDAGAAQPPSKAPPTKPASTTAKNQVVTVSPTLAKNQITTISPALIRHNTEPIQQIRQKQLKRSNTTPVPPAQNLALSGPAIVTGGLVGCAAGAAILLGTGIWNDFGGAESAILAAKSAKLCVDNLTEELITTLKAGTYSTDEALDVLRRTTLAYASTIPQGAAFVERVFREIATVRKQRGREIDRVVAQTYAAVRKASARGADAEEMRAVVLKQLATLSRFAANATRDVVARNPQLRPYREGAAKALQSPPESKVPTVRVNMAVRQK